MGSAIIMMPQSFVRLLDVLDIYLKYYFLKLLKKISALFYGTQKFNAVFRTIYR
jgi:hypothetical protein